MLVRRRWRIGGYANGLHLPFQVELLEADHLDPWKTSHGQNEVIDGVEFGPTGRVVAYHLFPQHPGSVWRKIRMESVRIPAADIIHVRRVDRPGQVRGVSWFAPVMMTLGDLSDYQEGEILKQKVAALMAGFLESDSVIDGEIAAKSPEDEAEDVGLGEIGPGTLTELPQGMKVTFTDPPTVNGYSPFMRQTLASIAMGLGITYEALAGDLSGVNFSSARMGRMEMDRNIETWQQLVMIEQFCRGIERWVKEAWVLKPKLGPADFALTWTAPRRPLIDPTKEVPAMIKEVNAGLTSRQRAQRQLGRDPDVIEREITEDNGRTRPAGPEPTQAGGQLNGK
jgi:lambda family phage portal protein